MTDRQEIRQLDQRTVEQIAAGEVVERPASAVRELVENSIDAGASRVTVAVTGGGATRLRVSDNGVGMDESALRQAVKEHTTSKLSGIEELETGVDTLGFRGEALHAIGAVSRLTITSRTTDSRGTELTVEGGELTDVSPAGCPEGTTVTVEDLFYNVPARRKYLKQDATEFAHINRVVTNYALANPDVAVTLTHDGNETIATTGSGALRETVLAVYGREVADAMIELEPNTAANGPLASVAGLVSHPETNRATSEYLSVFVNGRYVDASAVRTAIADAYDAQLAPDRYPFAAVFLDVDPATVDANVHPRKREVRFEAEAAVREQVHSVVEASLREAGVVRSRAPRGRSAPETTAVEPGAEPEPDPDPDPAGPKSSEASTVSAPATAASADPEQSGETRSETPSTTEMADPGAAGPARETDNAGSTAPAADADTGAGGTDDDDADVEPGPEHRSETESESESESELGPTSGGHTHQRQARLGGADSESTRAFDTLPRLRVLGQLDATYVVAGTDEGLVLIDQHAADERVHYERLRDQVAADAQTQALAEPAQIQVTPAEADRLSTPVHQAALDRLGVRARRVGPTTVAVEALPALVAETAGPELVGDLLAALAAGPDAAEQTVADAVDALLADLACHPAVTGNTSLTEGSVVRLLEALDATENPWACPHGRPVVIQIDTDEIATRFERDYPGHRAE